ncbi:LysR family transcriptional regulator [Achromobacter sp. SD115]|uniref:LysR family transcriptional regulator n=1 Tax=Achromobacter sp. SD115 TaxID=2782011 RepID=UPI001A975A00|nr:LysR family transcriptional regulator [Achromobacter sp. SD115]MBO1018151.1 LysR family transcriptional regulator [Achromobacter sp. SD115]
MRLPDLDLRLLHAFLVLYEQKNLRKASEELGISQAAMSRGLAKMRRAFDDPLFVSTARGVEPTPRAHACVAPISQIVELATERLLPTVPFDPATSDRQFSIAASDVGELVLIPELMRICAEWPGLRFNAQRLSIKSLPEELKSGAVDVAVGAFPALESAIHCRRLYTEQYVCLVRAENPLLSAPLTLTHFLDASHIVVSATVLGHIHSRVERTLIDMLPPSAVKLTSPSFLLGAMIASETDCVLVAPTALARFVTGRCGLEVLPCPLDIEPFDVVMYWHDRVHHDPAHRWLRTLIAESFGADKGA